MKEFDQFMLNLDMSDTLEQQLERGQLVPQDGGKVKVAPVKKTHPGRKLSDDDVRAIRHRLANGEKHKAVAADYGVSVGTTYDIWKRRRRANVQ